MKASEIIDKIAKEESWAHAYLFLGGIERDHESLFGQIVNLRKCHSSDISILKSNDETGKAGEIKVEEVRNLIHDLSLSPHGDCRIAVIFGAERLNLASANILLKTLEEPPQRAMLLLFATTDSLLSTIKSRCQIFRLPRYLQKGKLVMPSFIAKPFFEISAEIDLIIKDNGIDEFLDSMLFYLHGKMIETKSSKCVKMIKRLEKIRKQIRANANPKLALESLVILTREKVK